MLRSSTHKFAFPRKPSHETRFAQSYSGALRCALFWERSFIAVGPSHTSLFGWSRAQCMSCDVIVPNKQRVFVIMNIHYPSWAHARVYQYYYTFSAPVRYIVTAHTENHQKQSRIHRSSISLATLLRIYTFHILLALREQQHWIFAIIYYLPDYYSFWNWKDWTGWKRVGRLFCCDFHVYIFIVLIKSEFIIKTTCLRRRSQRKRHIPKW